MKEILALAFFAIAGLTYAQTLSLNLGQQQIEHLNEQLEKKEVYIQGIEKGANLAR